MSQSQSPLNPEQTTMVNQDGPALRQPKTQSPQTKTWKEVGLNFLVIAVLTVLIITFGQLFAPRDTLSSSKGELRQIIDEYYIGEIPDEKSFSDGQLKGYISALNDPYSDYMTASDNAQFEDNLNERYEGIGVRFEEKNNDINVVETLPSSPAERSGLQAGDVLLQVNRQDVKNLDLDQVAELILGPAGTEVNLLVARNTQELSFTIKREKIVSPLVRLTIVKDVAIIRISSFGEGLNQELLVIANQIADNQEVAKIILDLRSNGGGILSSAVDVVSYFVDPGLIVATEKTKQEIIEDKTLTKEVSLSNYPLVILTNRQTASASEIVAAALRDHRQAALIGQKTYGKGVVQQLFELQDGSYLKLTVAEWLTPKGERINEVGLTPNIPLDNGEDTLQVTLSRYNWETQTLNADQ